MSGEPSRSLRKRSLAENSALTCVKIERGSGGFSVGLPQGDSAAVGESFDGQISCWRRDERFGSNAIDPGFKRAEPSPELLDLARGQSVYDLPAANGEPLNNATTTGVTPPQLRNDAWEPFERAVDVVAKEPTKKATACLSWIELNRDALWPQTPQREGDPVPRLFREAR